jgi:hypothetical protein
MRNPRKILKTGFTGQMDSIVWYSATSSGIVVFKAAFDILSRIREARS